MAAVVHGCSSPRRHHGNTNTCHAQHQPHQNVYGTAMKYPRSPLSPSGHLHHYGENAYTQSSQYAAQALPQQAYLPQTNISMQQQQQQQQQQMQHQQQQQQSYAQTGNRPSSAGPSLSLCSNYWNHPHAAPMLYRSGRHHQKQKSAVELLAETKPFFVKSDAMLQRFQDASYRSSSAAVAAAATVNKRRVSMTNCSKDEKYNLSYDDLGQSIDMDHRYATATGYRLQNPPTHMGRRSVVSSSGNMLQNKLRTLLSAEGRQQSAGHYRQQLDYCGIRQTNLSELSNHDEDDNVPNVLPPLLYGSTSLNVDCGLNLEQNSEDEPLVLTENYRPISPPAEYAAQKHTQGNDNRYRFNYHRSYSHSHETAAEKLYQSTEDYNMDSHKSLPDLHSQTSRHSPHSEILSCCSRGNRSIKSAGESSLNRDSGGSSGHYTGSKSEPCYRQRDGMRLSIKNKNCCSTAVRRDSGSSTQHSGNSFYGQASPSMPQPTDYIGCTCKQPASLEPNDFFFNFATPEVPEEFQDDYTPPVSTLKGLHRGSSSSSHQYTSLNCSGSTNYSYNSLARSPDSAPSIDDAITPPPMQFKRQKCIRFKNRNRPVQYHHSSSHSGSINEAVEQCMAEEQRMEQRMEQQRERVEQQLELVEQQRERVEQRERMEQQRERVEQQRERVEQQRERVEQQRERADQQRAEQQRQRKQQQQHKQQQQQQQQHRQQSYALPKSYAAEKYENAIEKQQQQQNQMDSGAAAGATSLHYEEPAVRSRSNSIQELERFFDRLGLNDEKFHEIYNLSRRRGSGGSDNSGASSTVFFSDVSTVDSMRLPDSTETQPQTTQTYRPSEPPSIVERNARIIKWLCNCRKMQYA